MPGKWDGRSRIPTKQYKDNYNDIFRKKSNDKKTKGAKSKVQKRRQKTS